MVIDIVGVAVMTGIINFGPICFLNCLAFIR